MDHKVFLVRAAGTGSRPQKGVSRHLRLTDNGISISGILPSLNQSPEFYSFEHISKVLPSYTDSTELSIDVFGGYNRSDETLKFCCDSRAALLTALLNKLDDGNGIGTDYFLKKHSHKHGGLVEAVFRVRSTSIVKMVNAGVRQERHKVNKSKMLNLQDIEKMEINNEDEHIVLLYYKSREMRLSMKDSMPFLQAIRKNMKTYLNKDLDIGRISTTKMIENVSAYNKKLGESPVLYSFEVLKFTDDNQCTRRNVILLTSKHFIEKSQEEVIAVHRIDDIMGIIVPGNTSHEVILEFKFWRPTKYIMEDTDSFIGSVAALMDSNHSTKHHHFSIHQEPFLPGTFADKPHAIYLNECEIYYTSQFMVLFNSYQDRKVLVEVLKEYACNIHVGDSQCSDVRIVKAVTDLLQSCIRRTNEDINCAILCCIVLRSLLSSRTIFEAMKTMPEVFTTLLQCTQSSSGILSYISSMVIRSSIKFMGGGPVEGVSKLELSNRLVALNMDNMQQLIAILHNHSLAKNTVLQILGLIEVMLTAVSFENNEIESSKTWARIMDASILSTTKVICEIFRWHSTVIFQRNSLLLRSLLTNTAPDIQGHLQALCLKRGVVLVQLKNALFAESNEIWELSADLLYLMIEGNYDSRKLLESLVPKGIMLLYNSDALDDTSAQISGNDESIIRLSKWIDTVEVLRKDTLATPLLVWNDMKRNELSKFLDSELKRFYAALEINSELSYNSPDVELAYPVVSEGEGSVIGGVHLDLLPEKLSSLSVRNDALWQIKDPISLFQSVFQSMVLGFTPFFGHNNLPEVDLRLAAHALTWIYERHADNLLLSLTSLNVIEIVVGMLRELIETEHEVTVFKLLIFLLVVMDTGGRSVALRFAHAGGLTVLVQFAVLSLAKCCKNRRLFECDAWDSRVTKSGGAIETVDFISYDNTQMSIRVPAGKARDVLDKALQDGSLDAKQAIRWQDVAVPQKVQLGLSLDLLEAVFRVSGGDDNVQSFPPSVACCNLAKEEVLCHLVQILLRAKTPAFGRILEMVSYVVSVNDDAMKRIYKYGMFEILLWKLLAGDVVDSEKTMIIKFLRRFHLSQDAELTFKEEHMLPGLHSPLQNSILSLYLPEGLILKLILEDDEIFRTLLDSDVDDPEVIWNFEMKESLLEYLTNELEAYVKFRSSDALALYIHTSKPPLAYPELAEAIFIAPFYIQNLLDFERFPNYQINDPLGFLNNLMQELRKFTGLESEGSNQSNLLWRKEIHHIHLLLQAQAHLLEKYAINSLPDDLEAVIINLAQPALQTCLSQKEEPPSLAVDIVIQTTKILRRLCAVNSRNVDVPQAAMDFSISILALGTSIKNDNVYPEPIFDSVIEPAIAGSLLVLELLCSLSGGRHFLQNDIRWVKGLWWALCLAVGDISENPPRSPTTTSFAALKCLKSYVEDDQECLRMIEQGLYIPLLLLAIPLGGSRLKKYDSNSSLIHSAADVLGSWVRTLNRVGQFSKAKQKNSMPVSFKMIPHLLVQSLGEKHGADKFAAMALSDIIHPTTIWNSKVREELWQKLGDRLKYYNSTFADEDHLPMENELEWLSNFQYDCLKCERIIGGLYVTGICCCKVEQFSLPEGHSYLDEIQNYLLENLDTSLSVNTDSDDVNDELTSKEYINVVISLRKCLDYAIKIGREDLIIHFDLEIIQRLVSTGHAFQEIQLEAAKLVKSLSQLRSGLERVLRSAVMDALALQLWYASGKKGREHVLISTLEAIVLLSESMPATVSATNYFATSGLLLPLLAFFCQVDLPVLPISEVDSEQINPYPPSSQLLAAQVIGQLLLSASGINKRAKVLKQLAKIKSFSCASFRGVAVKQDDSIDATDMYNLFNLVEKLREQNKEEPLVIKTLLYLFPTELLSATARDPSEACDLFIGDSKYPLLVWDNGTRLIVRGVIDEEVKKVHASLVSKGLASLPVFCLDGETPVFVRWVQTVVTDEETNSLYRDNKAEGYSRELYIKGFYIDQFLRNPECDLGSSLEDRFLLEVRKAIVIGASMLGFDDKRRLLLALLLLFKLRPSLLSRRSSNDIFLPVLFFMGTDNQSEQRGLAQAATLLLHCTATDSNLADCMCSDELFSFLSTMLELEVPESYAGFAGTDPQFCSLILLLRLTRLSSTAVELALHTNFIPKLVKLLRLFDNHMDDTEEAAGLVGQKAAECLAVMASDKRKGPEVSKLLETVLPKDLKANQEWRASLADIRDEMVDSRTLNHLLRHRYPSQWWTSSPFEHTNGNNKDWIQ